MKTSISPISHRRSARKSQQTGIWNLKQLTPLQHWGRDHTTYWAFIKQLQYLVITDFKPSQSPTAPPTRVVRIVRFDRIVRISRIKVFCFFRLMVIFEFLQVWKTTNKIWTTLNFFWTDHFFFFFLPHSKRIIFV